jgi:hypothetical protein
LNLGIRCAWASWEIGSAFIKISSC